MILYLKHSLPLVIILFLITFLSTAQTDTLQQASAHEKTQAIRLRMEKELTLSKDQSTKVNKILMDRSEELAQSTSDLSFENANRKALQKLAAILNKDQYSLYQQLRTKKKQDKEEYLRNHPGFVFSKEDLEMDF